MLEMALSLLHADAQLVADHGVESPALLLNVFESDQGIGWWVFAITVHQEDAMEDLHRMMRIHGRYDLGDVCQVSIDKLAEPPVVIDGSGARSPPDIQLEVRDAEGILHVDHNQAHPRSAARVRANVMIPRPVDGRVGNVLIGHSPHFADLVRIEVRRKRQLRRYHRNSSPLSEDDTPPSWMAVERVPSTGLPWRDP